MQSYNLATGQAWAAEGDCGMQPRGVGYAHQDDGPVPPDAAEGPL